MSTAAERQRRRRARLAQEGIETITIIAPAHHAPALRELARHLCQHREHTFLPAVRLKNGRLKFLKE